MANELHPYLSKWKYVGQGKTAFQIGGQTYFLKKLKDRTVDMLIEKYPAVAASFELVAAKKTTPAKATDQKK